MFCLTCIYLTMLFGTGMLKKCNKMFNKTFQDCHFSKHDTIVTDFDILLLPFK